MTFCGEKTGKNFSFNMVFYRFGCGRKKRPMHLLLKEEG
jgi:hypothetical protein